jgi:hypothetical protein
MDRSSPTPPIYISYAWGDAKYDPIVENLCSELKKIDQIEIGLDKNLRTGDLFNNFYAELARAPLLISVISDKYFYSPNCMIKELWPSFCRVDQNEEEFSRKTIFLVLESAEKHLECYVRSNEDPLENIKSHWINAIKNAEINGDPDLDKMKMLLYGKKNINNLVRIINAKKMPRGAEAIRDQNFKEIRSEIRRRLTEWVQETVSKVNVLSPSLFNEMEWNCLVAKNPLGLPALKSIPTPSVSKAAKKISTLYLMVQLDVTGEPDRLSLVPELQVHPPVSFNRAEWPLPLSTAENKLKPINNVSLKKKAGNIKYIGECLGEWLSLAMGVAAEINSNSSDRLPVVLELFLPDTLLYHDFGDLIRIPITVNSQPLGSSYSFMVRSLERARHHAAPSRAIPPILAEKWRYPKKLRKMLLISRLHGESPSSNSFANDLSDKNWRDWRKKLYATTQSEDVGICVVLPALSNQPEHHELLMDLVDSWLPLVVFWSAAPTASSLEDTKTTSDAAAARLSLVGALLEATEPLNLTDLEIPGLQLAEVVIKKLRLDHLAHRRKQLRCSSAYQNGSSQGHAIVLMDDPNRWPRRLIISSG